MQQRRSLADVPHVRRRRHQCVHQARFLVDADVRFQAEVPLIPFLCLVHLGFEGKWNVKLS